MNIWLKIIITDVIIIAFNAFLQYVYTDKQHPLLHTIFTYIVSVAVLVMPVFLITFVWSL